MEGAEAERAAQYLADRIATVLGAPCIIAGHAIQAAASCVIAVASEEDAVALLRRADMALYQAKAQGRARGVRTAAGQYGALVEPPTTIVC